MSNRVCWLVGHLWDRWFNLEGGPPYLQRRRCMACGAEETR